ncbi:PPK2 family polyphosphate kinase [Fimbriimonas ginsengisoli]|uniref:UDP-galactose-lipid carrier transferase n=1 Tax=Fimbriimonas ginsengisoli Gsoil 348 TaxID=661478 RepID=A0A068NST9_FIMGI|nr:PPK2 family polyphosphate kinase [Fimbriimonas ginsengisoli]AIE84684.1 UDP-galactose-lipid carrier transferase [Fimbriimonas ginsengisoli Gsoil 348]
MPYAYEVKPGGNVNLSQIDPEDTAGLDKEEGLRQLFKLGERMAELQELLFAARQHSLLIVLQGRDTSGKDGAIRRILDFVNVQSTRVATFKVPTENELAHDFLWRVHAETPGKGAITIFNRSHYEDVLAVRVHEFVPKPVWKKRYDHINAFERLLTDSQTIVLKFYLHIDKKEQEARLLEREKEPEKSWKLSVGDWEERKLWDKYTDAYEDAIQKCSTQEAIWRIVPANHKWFRDLAVAEAVIRALEPYEDGWREALAEQGKERTAELAEYRAKK